MTHLRQAWAVPSKPRPIVIIGAGGVVRTAHLPVYKRLKFPVAGLYDINPDTSRDTARRFGVSTVFSSLAEAAMSADAVFDLAVPGDQITGVLKELPRGAAVLIQKPMGEDLATARSIVGICRERSSSIDEHLSCILHRPEKDAAGTQQTGSHSTLQRLGRADDAKPTLEQHDRAGELDRTSHRREAIVLHGIGADTE